MAKNNGFINKILIGILLSTFIIFSIVYTQNGYKNFLDLSEFSSNNYALVSKIEATFKIKFKGSFNDEKIIYEFKYDEKNRIKEIFIREDSWGPLGESVYTMEIDEKISPKIVDFRFDSDFEKSYWHVRYEYFDDKIIFKDIYKKEQKTLTRENPLVCDSLYLMEFLTFVNLEKYKQIDSTAYLVFNTFKVPFGFKVLSEENITTPFNKNFSTYKVEANARGFIGFLSYAIGNNGRFNVIKEFPHLRVYALYASKEYWLYDYKIDYLKK
ncbi:MAG: hypothetical protein N3A58_08915 [Spirochaetes bacterium]|nr:hypothetical protein [Spirochaetota bacterium]